MGCIIAARGTFALCGKKLKAQSVREFFTNKIDCVECLIRQDAMFARDYKQEQYACWYNNMGMYQCIPVAEYRKYGNLYHAIPVKSMFVGVVSLWDMKTLKGAIKLAK